MPGPFDRIFQDVRKDLPSVTDATLRQELFRVLDDFTQTTNIFRSTIEFAVDPAAKSYTLSMPVGEGKANRLMLVYDTASTTMNWAAPGITMRIPGVIQLWQAPQQAGTWAAIVAKRTAEPLSSDKYPNIDEWIVEKYADCLGRGILARLMWEPQKPYSNPMLAAQNQRAYIDGRSLARANDGHANVYDGQNWRYPQQWATVQRRPWT
jgi:hypothetical protein